MSRVYSCLLLILINIIVDTGSGCGAILKTRPSTITYKNKSGQYSWQQGFKIQPASGSCWLRGDQLTWCTQGRHRYTLTYWHQLIKFSISDVSPGSEAEVSSQRKMWSLNSNESVLWAKSGYFYHTLLICLLAVNLNRKLWTLSMGLFFPLVAVKSLKPQFPVPISHC